MTRLDRLRVVMCSYCVVCFFKQKTAYEMRISDWSSDVCSSDLSHPLDEGSPREDPEIAGHERHPSGENRPQRGGNERRQAGRFPKRGKETDELRHHDERAGRGLCQSEAVQHFSGLEPPEGAHGFLRDIGQPRISAAERHHRHLAEEGRSEAHTSKL